MSLSDILVFEHMAPFTWKGIATAIASGVGVSAAQIVMNLKLLSRSYTY